MPSLVAARTPSAFPGRLRFGPRRCPPDVGSLVKAPAEVPGRGGRACPDDRSNACGPMRVIWSTQNYSRMTIGRGMTGGCPVITAYAPGRNMPAAGESGHLPARLPIPFR